MKKHLPIKLKRSFKGSLLLFFTLLTYGLVAQTSDVSVVYSPGYFDEENSWQLYNVTTDTELACYDEATTGAFSNTYTITNSDVIELRGWENYGYGWDGATITLTNTTTATTLFDGAAPNELTGAVTCGTNDTSGDVLFNGEVSPSCAAVSNVSASAVTTSSATINWMDGSGCVTAYSITSTPAIGGGMPIIVNCGVQTTNLTGLTSGTSYTLTITSDCGSNPAAMFTFTTLPDYCSGDEFMDEGGSGDYPSNANMTWTICPDLPTDKVSISFSEFAVEDNGPGTCYDQLKIYDGDDNTAAQIGPAAGFCYDGAGSNGTGYPGGGLGVPIVSSHSTGCLHFEFTSDASVTRAGWVADVTCETYTEPSTMVALAPVGTTTMTADNAVPGTGGFTYYEDPNNPGNFLFAVNWDAAGNGLNDASDVTVTIDNAAADGTADDGTNATWTMKRYWNVDMGAGNLVDPVDVKFFYDAAEKTATEMMASSDGRPLETPAWFKTPDGTTWNNVPGAGNPVVNAIELTDANAGAGSMENGIVFAEFAGIPSFSGGSFASGVGVAGASALPVELSAFSGKSMGQENQLNWTTASEDNASHYEVLRRTIENNRWESIGEVQAFGNSSASIDYAFMDKHPRSTHLYRLKIVDLDGAFEYSDVISIHRKQDSDEVTSIYPNPTVGNIVIEHITSNASNIDIQIYDVQGQIVFQQNNLSMEAGISKIPIQTEELNAGVYMLHIKSNANSQVIKFIKN